MKKLALAFCISLILILTSCSAIPGMSVKPKTTKKSPATTPTLIERITALETQEVNILSKLDTMQSQIDDLTPPDQKTAGDLQTQVFTLQKQIDDQLVQIKALQAKIP